MLVEETFFRMLRHREFDVAEMSLSSCAVSLARDAPPFIAIPVFPSRFFRHSSIYVSAAAGIREPRDLVDKRVGNPEYPFLHYHHEQGLSPRRLEPEARFAPETLESYRI